MTLTALKLEIHALLGRSGEPAREACELLGVVAAVMTVQVGRPGAAAVIYAIADQVATGPKIGDARHG